MILSGYLASFFAFRRFSYYIVSMTIEQTVIIPADYRLYLELPRSVPSGVKAWVKINISADPAKDTEDFSSQTSLKIEEVRLLLQKEMAEKDTLAAATVSGDGWEAHIREHYARP